MADVTKEIVLEVGLKDSTAQGTTSAKQRLRELQKTLIDMSLAGQEGTKAFKEMEQEAGKLKTKSGTRGSGLRTSPPTPRISTPSSLESKESPLAFKSLKVQQRCSAPRTRTCRKH